MRPKTPLTGLSQAVTDSAGVVGRRSAVIAASSGLVVTMGLPAEAAVLVQGVSTSPAGDVAVPSAFRAPAASAAPVVAPVSAPATAKIEFHRGAFTAVAPAPPPPPPPVEAPVVEPEAPVADPEDEADHSHSDEDGEERSGDRASRSEGREEIEASEPAPAPEAASAPQAAGGSVMAIAARYVGTPYRYGGTTPSGFDCSGFVQYVYAQVGISLPRTANEQINAGRRVSRSEARPGDIVSFVKGGRVYHNGLYAGGNMLYDSPRTGKSLSKREIWTSNVVFTRVS